MKKMLKLITAGLLAVSFVGGATVAMGQAIPMNDITAAQLTALDAQVRLQQQQHDNLASDYWPQDNGFDNQFMPDDFNNFGGFGGGGGGESVLSPSMELDISD